MFKKLSKKTKILGFVLVVLMVCVLAVVLILIATGRLNSSASSPGPGPSASGSTCTSDQNLSSEIAIVNQTVLNETPSSSLGTAINTSINILSNTQAPIRQQDYDGWVACRRDRSQGTNCSGMQEDMVKHAIGAWLDNGTQPIRDWLNIKLGLMKSKNPTAVSDNMETLPSMRGSVTGISVSKSESSPPFSVKVQPVLNGESIGAELSINGIMQIGSTIIKSSATYNRCQNVFGSEQGTGKGELTGQINVSRVGQPLWFSFTHSGSDLISTVQLTGSF